MIYHPTMLARAWSLLLLLVASSLLVATTAHAREVPGGATVECSGLPHVERGGDASPADPDKAFAHHHGACHAHALGLPAAAGWGLVVVPSRLAPVAAHDAARPRGSVDPALRPPAA